MNFNLKNVTKKLLSDNWYTLHKYTFDYKGINGKWETTDREVYHRGNGATILLYNKDQQTVVLIQQFRIPTYVNGNTTGLLIEACAGFLDDEHPEDAIRRETEEETGYRVNKVEKVFEVYMSPGSVTELLHFFVAEYEPSMKVSEGGGLDTENENITVLELPFTKALQMIKTGEIQDAKTIMLLQHAKLSGLLD